MHPERKALRIPQLSQLFDLFGAAGRDPLDNAY
jgi:hypothetical protein